MITNEEITAIAESGKKLQELAFKAIEADDWKQRHESLVEGANATIGILRNEIRYLKDELKTMKCDRDEWKAEADKRLNLWQKSCTTGWVQKDTFDAMVKQRDMWKEEAMRWVDIVARREQ